MKRLVFALALLGCNKGDSGPTCAQVTDHMLEVTKQQLTGHGNLELGNRKQMIDVCEQRHLTAEQKRCIMSAKTLPALGDCQKAIGSAH
jgi:hypothetical protein